MLDINNIRYFLQSLLIVNVFMQVNFEYFDLRIVIRKYYKYKICIYRELKFNIILKYIIKILFK
jgi:hypothetical protein